MRDCSPDQLVVPLKVTNVSSVASSPAESRTPRPSKA